MSTVTQVADGVIAASYFAIPLGLLYFCNRSPVKHQKTRLILLLFVSFILLCGCTHLLTLLGLHKANEVCKVVTAAVSLATAAVLVRVIPEILQLLIESEERVNLLDQTCEYLTHWRVFNQTMMMCQDSVLSHQQTPHQLALDILRSMFPRETFDLRESTEAGQDDGLVELPIHDKRVLVLHPQLYNQNRRFFDDVRQQLWVQHGSRNVCDDVCCF